MLKSVVAKISCLLGMSLCFSFFGKANAEVFTVNESGVYNSSMSVFSTDYDIYMDPLYWCDIEQSVFMLQAGLQNDYLSVGAATNYFGFYAALDANQRITDYKYWPDNQTDEEYSLLLGFNNNLAAKIHYFDFCYSEGRGIIQPGITFSKKFDLGNERAIRAMIDASWKQIYYESMTIEYSQPNFTVQVDYGRNRDNGVGLSYYVMPSAHKNDWDESPAYHKIGFWVGKTFDFEDNFSLGIRPQGYFAVHEWYRAFNKTTNHYEYAPEDKTMAAYMIVPLSFKYTILDGKVDLFASLLIGFYYANFKHIGNDHSEYIDGTYGPGGRNLNGCIPLTGYGLGASINISKRANLTLGSKIIRVPEARINENGDVDTYRYDAKSLSLAECAKSPLYISLSFKK